MHPVLIRLWFLPPGYQNVYSYGFMMALGFFVAMVLGRILLKRSGQNPEHLLNLALLTLITGLLGARLFFVVHYWPDYAGGPLRQIFNIRDGGLELYGGVALAILAMLIYFLGRKLPVLLYLDALAPALMIGLAFGRIGCFLHGCCYGQVCRLPWAVSFPYRSFAYRGHSLEGRLTVPSELADSNSRPLPFDQLGDSRKDLARRQKSLPVHPTQLYSAASALLLCVILAACFRRRKYSGQILIFALLLYGLSRFTLETLRIEPKLPAVGISAAQLVSLIALLLAAILWSILRRRRLQDHPAPQKAHTPS